MRWQIYRIADHDGPPFRNPMVWIRRLLVEWAECHGIVPLLGVRPPFQADGVEGISGWKAGRTLVLLVQIGS